MTIATAEFPLYLHKASGHWCKTIRRKRHYFGKDRQAAFERWIKERDDLLAGRTPQKDGKVVTVAEVCNYCLTKKAQRVEDGDLSQRQFNDLKTMAEFLVEHFGRNRSVATITIEDWGALRRKMAKRWAPSGLVSRIGNIRHFFAFGYENDFIDRPMKYGDQFKLPSKKRRRKARAEKGKRLFTAAEIQKLLKHASPHLTAFLLLGINSGSGNADIAKLKHKDIDLTSGWLDCLRPKTHEPRRAKLWKETCDAIREAVENQPVSRRNDTRDLVFLTRLKQPWSNPNTSTCALAQAFRKLANEAGVYEPGKTFYALRHTFETVAADTKEQAAIDWAMGHEDGHIRSAYREEVSDESLERVADYMHEWLFGQKKRKGKK